MRRIAPTLMVVCALWFQPVAAAFAAEAAIPSMPWAMAPGESLQQLAALIYPYSSVMQQRFVQAALALNRPQLGEMTADSPFPQATQVAIPDLQYLARTAPSQHHKPLKLRLSRVPAAVPAAAVEPQAAAFGESRLMLLLSPQIEALAQRSRALKLEQEAMEQRLSLLEANMRALWAALAENRTRPPIPYDSRAQRSPDKVVTVGVFSLPQSLPTAWWLSGAGLAAALLAGFSIYRRRKQPSTIAVTIAPAIPIPAAPGSVQSPAVRPSLARDAGGLLVDEIVSVVEEAKVLVALGRNERAVELLSQHIASHPHASITPWLSLLELHRSAGRKEEFLALGKRMHQVFNIMAPQWDLGSVAMVVPTTLEAFPHIMQSLVERWGTAGCRDYLNELIQDNREGERTGFSLDVLNEILLLLAILELREA